MRTAADGGVEGVYWRLIAKPTSGLVRSKFGGTLYTMMKWIVIGGEVSIRVGSHYWQRRRRCGMGGRRKGASDHLNRMKLKS